MTTTTTQDRLRHVAGAAALELRSLDQMRRAGMLHLDHPATLLTAGRAMRRAGPLAAAPHLAAGRHGHAAALVDERGPVSFDEVRDRTMRLAARWHRAGVTSGDGVGILVRNHRGIVDATFAAATLGARAVFLNTDFSGPQTADVCAREGVTLLVHDEEFADVAAQVTGVARWLAWTDDPAGSDLEQACVQGPVPAVGDLPRPAREGSLVLLTSGTTGQPKGANRQQPRSLSLIGGLLSRIPYRPGNPLLVGPPLFHALGLGTALLNYAMGNTLVLTRRFDPTEVLALLERHRCGSMTVVPVMLNRLLAAGPEAIAARDLSALSILLCAGARLEPSLSERTMAAFGDVLYNLYGSTEVSAAAIADPADLRAAPGCVGRPPIGVEVRILDEEGRPVHGTGTGRVFVGSPNTFDGYTGGGSKEVVDGLMSSGDVGHLDEGGRLVIEGRDDDMIVSGGENVFPGEIEELLVTHPGVDQACVVGVDDTEFGQRLRAVVVRRPGVQPTAEELQEYVRTNLARYKVPREVRFVDDLPRNPTGKVLRRELTR